MAFIAEFISEADKERYRLDSYMPKARGNNWVIDRERSCFLRYLDSDSSRLDVGGYENPYEHWLFYYQVTPIIIDMCLNGSDENRPCLTYQIDHIYIYQGLSKIAISLPSLLKEIKVEKDYFSSLLKEAMDIFDLYCYGLSKNPYPYCYFLFLMEN